ncbi:MAG: acyl-CoA dehydrogenase family protein [Proteobacteria bacterium]|nr:acyl-CoA dehydrogenase family protein [Pseudomonadota bacterium]
MLWGLPVRAPTPLKLDDVLVPEIRHIVRQGRNLPYLEGGGPISIARQHPVGPYSLTSVVVGAAGGFIDQFVEQMKDRASRFGNKIADFQSLQLRIAESSAEYEAARRIILANLRETMAYLAEGTVVPPEIESRNKRDMGYAPTLAVQAVGRLFYAGGANFLFKANPLERQFRDVHAGSHQLAQNWDIYGTQYGRGTLGLPPMR